VSISDLLRVVLLLIMTVEPAAWGQGRKPKKKSTESPSTSHPVKTAKDNTNQALGHVDQGIHEALHESKDAANKALNAVDEGVHKVIGSNSNK
jgi:hypothetical protein